MRKAVLTPLVETAILAVALMLSIGAYGVANRPTLELGEEYHAVLMGPNVRMAVTVSHKGADGFTLYARDYEVGSYSFFPASDSASVDRFMAGDKAAFAVMRGQLKYYGKVFLRVKGRGGKVDLLDVRLENSE